MSADELNPERRLLGEIGRNMLRIGAVLLAAVVLAAAAKWAGWVAW